LAVSPLVLPHLDQISPMEAIDGIPADVPVLILAGQEDRLARPEEAEALYRRVKSHGELHVFLKAGHLGMLWSNPERYHGLVNGFIDRIRPATD
jgi:pimeloyl-ACP methyl ester carboxylesterase